MTIRKRVAGVALAGAMVAGIGVVAAAPAQATTEVRGDTAILTCDDLAIGSMLKDAGGAGLGFPVRSLKVSGISHPEKWAPGDPSQVKKEPDDGVSGPGTPDYGDTDTCSGVLTSNSNQWASAGHYEPYSPAMNLTSSFNELTNVAGALWGRASCQSGIVDATQWQLHGKLVLKFSTDTGPNNVFELNAAGKPVQAQAYVTGGSSEVDLDLGSDGNGDTDPTNDYQTDLVDFEGIGIKGIAEGAWYDSRGAFRPSALNLAFAAEACSLNADVTADTVIGIPPAGGLSSVVLDSDVDNFAGSTITLTGSDALAYNNSMVFSYDA